MQAKSPNATSEMLPRFGAVYCRLVDATRRRGQEYPRQPDGKGQLGGQFSSPPSDSLVIVLHDGQYVCSPQADSFRVRKQSWEFAGTPQRTCSLSALQLDSHVVSPRLA